MGKRELVALLVFLGLTIVVWLFLMMQGVCLQFVIVVFPDFLIILTIITDCLVCYLKNTSYIGNCQNFYSSCSMRHLPWRMDEWIFSALDRCANLYSGWLTWGDGVSSDRQ